MDLGVAQWSDMDWIVRAQVRDKWKAPLSTVMKLRLP
jgi:hypothetical protein